MKVPPSTGDEVAEEEAPAEEEEDVSEKKTQGSPHIDLSILFVKPVVGDGKGEFEGTKVFTHNQ